MPQDNHYFCGKTCLENWNRKQPADGEDRFAVKRRAEEEEQQPAALTRPKRAAGPPPAPAVPAAKKPAPVGSMGGFMNRWLKVGSPANDMKRKGRGREAERPRRHQLLQLAAGEAGAVARRLSRLPTTLKLLRGRLRKAGNWSTTLMTRTASLRTRLLRQQQQARVRSRFAR
uniref:Uncharacterized protein n=2 Tax=Coccolithus braarudii TaxID=221442 RepID=A0A7S0L8D8_9EUKA